MFGMSCPGGSMGPRSPNWSLRLGFADMSVLPSCITYSGGANGTYFDSSGVLQTSGANEARFDHDPATLNPFGLLIEEARTNLFLRSEEFSNVAWAKTRSTVTGDATVAPNGTTTADKLVEDSTAANNHYITIYTSVVSGVSYTFSSFAKKADYDRINFQFSTTRFPATVKGTFNLVTGVIDETTGSPDASSITDVGGGWFRCSLTATADSTGSNPFFIVLDEGTGGAEDTTIDGDGTSGTFIWGAQLEAGAFPTSYIKTTTTAILRSADVATIALSDVPEFDETQGTFFVEGSVSVLDPFQYLMFMNNGNSDTLDAHIILIDMDNHMRYLVANTVDVANFHGGGSPSINTAFKVAVTYALNDFSGYFDGTAMGTDTSGAPPTSQTIIQLGNRYDAARALNGHIARIVYWNRRLSNSQLQNLTA